MRSVDTTQLTQQELIALVQQGDVAAIGVLLGRSLSAHRVAVQVRVKETVLHILLDAVELPSPLLGKRIHAGLVQLKLPRIQQARIYGRRQGEPKPQWSQTWQLENDQAVLPHTGLRSPSPTTPGKLAVRSPAPLTRSVPRPTASSPSGQSSDSNYSTWQKLGVVVTFTGITGVILWGTGLLYVPRFFQRSALVDPAPLLPVEQPTVPVIDENTEFRAELADADEALQQNAKNATAWYARGKALSGLKQWSSSLASFDRALKLRPQYAEVWAARSLPLQQLQRHSQAVASIAKALQLQPDSAIAWEARCRFWSSAKSIAVESLSTILAACDKALNLDPNSRDAWLYRGQILNLMKQPSNALKSLDQAIQLKPNFYAALVQQGMILGKLQQFSAALKAFDRALQATAAPEAEIWFYRGYTLVGMQRYQEAVQSYQTALEHETDRKKAQAIHNAIIFARQQWQRSLQLQKSNNPRLLKQLEQTDAWMSAIQFTQDIEEELSFYDRLLQIDPTHYHAWNNRAWILKRLKRYDEALQSFDRALKTKPDFSWAWYNRGLVLEELGRQEDALKSYDRAIALGSFPAVERARSNLVKRMER